MAGTFTGLSILSSALQAFQTQLDVTGQNIANVNTTGYSRQTVELNEADPVSVTEGNTVSLGTGVSVETVNRIRDMFLQGASVTASSSLGSANAVASNATSVAGVIQEPSSTGISNDLNAFWNAWSALSADPSSSAAQLTVQQAGQTLANDVSNAYNGLQSVQQGLTQTATSTVSSIQQDLNQIASLNTQIETGTAQGAPPNDLMDQRDQAVQNLSSMINVNVQSYNGAYVISSGGVTLVDQAGARTIPTQFNPATSTLSGPGSPTIQVTSGQLAGISTASNQVTSYQNSLNTVADQLRSEVNGVYAGAMTPAGTGALFFNAGTGASTLDLDSTGLAGPPPVQGVKNNPGSIATGTTGDTSDGSVALQISNLGTQADTSLGNQSINNYYAQFVDQVGSDGQNAQNAQSTQTAVSQQVASQIQSVSGVSLDDEMSNMLQFQRSYQAAAQAVTAFDQTTQSLISMMTPS